MSKMRKQEINTSQQFFSVNSRPIYDKEISYALKVAYGDFLPSGRFCSASINIYCDPKDVDINVHPTKEQVQFASPKDLNKILVSSVREGIGSTGIKASTRLSSFAKEAFLKRLARTLGNHSPTLRWCRHILFQEKQQRTLRLHLAAMARMNYFADTTNITVSTPEFQPPFLETHTTAF